MDLSRKVLYIEDNPTNFHIVERLLRGEGFQVLHAPDGFEGVQKAIEERERLDLILMDINLPGMDGYEAATKLKTLQGFDSIPIIAVTVNNLQGDRKRCLAAGCDGFIPKPIDVDTFPERVKEYIRGKRDVIRAADERFYLREHARKLVDRLESSIGQLRLSTEHIRHKDKLASLGEMAASVAHELNNPLSSISFAVHLLMREAGNGERQTRQLELIERNIDRIRRLAEGLTSFARPSDVEQGEIDLTKVLDEVAVLSEHEFRTRGIHLEKELTPAGTAVWANESQLQHVFLNLIRNAAQAVSGRMKGQESTGNGFRGQVTLGLRRHEPDWVCVEVVDNGTGIHPEYQDRLFRPFFTTKPRGEGTGLGLFIVKEIVDGLLGRIDLQSTLGSGTTVAVHLPTRAGAARKI